MYVAPQAPLSMGFSRQEYWSGLPFLSRGGSSQPKDQTLVSCMIPYCLRHQGSQSKAFDSLKRGDNEGESNNLKALCFP